MAGTAPMAAGPAWPAGGYVAIDDGGHFSHHPDSAGVVAHFEYPDEAVCVLDRGGNCHRLVAGERGMVLTRPHGTVDFHWLRHEWLLAMRRFPEDHRIRRVHPHTLATLLADIFETMQLAPMLTGIGGAAHVTDAYGHRYRVVRHGRLTSTAKPRLWLVEVGGSG